MTKTTNIQSKSELLALSNKLGEELVNIEGEINTIKTKLDSASNYDGLNFEGAASVIKTNLTNVLTAMNTLSTNIASYVTELNEFDQYENPVQEDDLVAPEMTLPDETITPPGETDKPSTETPEDKKDETPNPTPTPPGDTTNQEQKPDDETDKKPDETPDKEEDETPTPSPQPSPSPNPNPNPNPSPSPQPNPTPQPEPTPEFKPEELEATDPVVVGIGDPNVDVSNFQNNVDLGYEVTTGNTSYQLGESDFELLCAIIEAESDGTYDGTLAVASTILNRCENAEYQQLHGIDPIAQITAANQFEGYTSGEFQQYMGKNSEIVIEAVKAALAGVRNHKLCTL